MKSKSDESDIIDYDADLLENEQELLSNFCKYFETSVKTSDGKTKSKGDGYKFEYFLRYYLDLLGFECIEVTRKSRDGGVDLKAECKLNLNTHAIPESMEKYYIQAKFMSIDKKKGKPKYLSPHEIQALRGSIENGRGILITTGKIAQKNFEDALYRTIKPIIFRNIPIQLIDARILIHSFEELEVPFVNWDDPNYSIDTYKLDDIIKKNKEEMGDLNAEKANKAEVADGIAYTYKRTGLSVNISHNDIKCKILSIPSAFIPKHDDVKSVLVNTWFPNEEKEEKYSEHKVTLGRNFISGLTDVYREHKLLDTSGKIIETEFLKYKSLKAHWHQEKEGDAYKYRIIIELIPKDKSSD